MGWVALLQSTCEEVCALYAVTHRQFQEAAKMGNPKWKNLLRNLQRHLRELQVKRQHS